MRNSDDIKLANKFFKREYLFDVILNQNQIKVKKYIELSPFSIIK